MQPSYNEIIEMNEGLKSRSREEVVRLIETILNKGFIWDDHKKHFYHKEIGMHIRTQGLDLFDPERFEKAFQTWSNPQYARGAALGQKYIPRILILFLTNLFIVWI